MKSLVLSLAVGLAVVLAWSDARAQRIGFDRLPAERLDANPPTTRVRGLPGQLALQAQACRTDIPLSEVRRRIVDIAAQEWAYFGFPVVDETPRAGLPNGFPASNPPPRRMPRTSPAEVQRTAASVAGYWSVTPEGAWIVERQNEAFRRPGGAARWLDPWSAAFISWVMCEAGLGESEQFRRAVAHHSYIDQAIRARDGQAAQAAFVAYDVGERALAPGDLLCAGRRPVYRSLAERRRQMGVGARSHCDIVVGLDEAQQRILAIGGNVRGTVGLKLLPASRAPDGSLRPLTQSTDNGMRPVFAHLKLRSDPIDALALRATPTLQALACAADFTPPAEMLAATLPVPQGDGTLC